MSESKTERERKAGGKNVRECTCGERSAKGREKKSVKMKKKERKDTSEKCEKIREKIREKERERVS